MNLKLFKLRNEIPSIKAAKCVGTLFAMLFCLGSSTFGELVVDSKEMTLPEATGLDIQTSGFTVRNRSAAPIIIKRIKASCGCTVFGKWKSVIKSNGETYVPFQISTPDMEGINKIYIMVKWARPESSEISETSFMLLQPVKKALSIQPERIDYGSIDQNVDILKHNLAINYNPLLIQGVKVAVSDGLNGILILHKEKTAENQLGYELVVDSDSLPEGQITGRIVVTGTLTSGRSCAWTVPIRIKSKKNFNAEPEFIFLSSSDEVKPDSGKIIVNALIGHWICEGLDLGKADNVISVSHSNLADGRVCLTYSSKRPREAKPFSGYFSVKMRNLETSKIKILRVGILGLGAGRLEPDPLSQ